MIRLILTLCVLFLFTHQVKANNIWTSFYGAGEHRNKFMANGHIFNSYALVAAHRTLPFNTRLLIEYNGRHVIVTVTDRGPARWTGKSLDLSYGAAKKLGIIKRGTAFVSIKILN